MVYANPKPIRIADVAVGVKVTGSLGLACAEGSGAYSNSRGIAFPRAQRMTVSVHSRIAGLLDEIPGASTHIYPIDTCNGIRVVATTSKYGDTYWEMYGYHERGNLWKEERFKGEGRKPVPRKAFGAV
jgi:hypothetical protein